MLMSKYFEEKRLSRYANNIPKKTGGVNHPAKLDHMLTRMKTSTLMRVHIRSIPAPFEAGESEGTVIWMDLGAGASPTMCFARNGPI